MLEACIYQGNEILLNLSTTAILGTEESGHGKVVAVVESFLTGVNVWMGTKKSGHSREMAISRGSTIERILIVTDLVTVFDTILTSKQTREKLQFLYENLMSNNFCRMAVLKKKMICKLELHSQGFY